MAKKNMNKSISAYFTRRDFIKTSGIATGGLILGVHVTACSTLLKKGGPALKQGQNFAPNCFLRIGPEEDIRILIGSSEMEVGFITWPPNVQKVLASLLRAHQGFLFPTNLCLNSNPVVSLT